MPLFGLFQTVHLNACLSPTAHAEEMGKTKNVYFVFPPIVQDFVLL